MKLLFQSFSGKDWAYDLQTGKLTPYNADEASSEASTSQCYDALAEIQKKDIREALTNGSEALILNVTEACSNRCRYCIYGGAYGYGRTHSTKSMSVEDALKAVDWFLEHNAHRKVRYISFYGGEPMFDKGYETIQAVVRHLEGKVCFGEDCHLSLTTNGNHLTKETIHFLAKYHFNVMVSLDGPKEIHNDYRISAAGKPTFDNIMAHLALAQHLEPEWYRKHITFICVLTPPLRYRERSDFFRTHPLITGHSLLVSNVSLYEQTLFDDKTVEDFTVETIRMTNEAARVYLEAAQHGEAESYTFEYGLFGKFLALLERLDKEGEQTNVLPLVGCCIPGEHKCFVDTDGTLYACEKMQGSYPLGSLKEGLSEERIIHLMRSYRELVAPKCVTCPYARLCGMCYVSAVDKHYKLSEEQQTWACRERASFSKLLLRLYASLKEFKSVH